MAGRVGGGTVIFIDAATSAKRSTLHNVVAVGAVRCGVEQGTFLKTLREPKARMCGILAYE